MGEVYRAHDTKLNRDVALKVLPEPFALDPDRLARFKREAQLLASLNHPNIAAIHGFEESDGIQALVLELVEGPTLADRLAQGRSRSTRRSRSRARSPRRSKPRTSTGIIHRDLKPANIKVRAGRHGEGAGFRAGQSARSDRIGTAAISRSRRRSRAPR